MTRSIFTAMTSLLLALSLTVRLDGQVAGATISGTVTDASGAAIPGAVVSVKNNATGDTRQFITDTVGFYAAPNLPAGTYEIRVTAIGFSTAVQGNVALGVGAQQGLNFSMKVGETAQSVEVTEQAPQVQLTSSALSGEVEAQTVRELPLNGRDWTQLATLEPGVAKIETQMSYDTSARGNRGFGSQYSISGGRTTFNNYRIDGISVVDYGNAAPGNVIGVVLGVDSIQEFSVMRGGFSAEYGRAASGVVNAITKSGTNSFHGNVYEFLRNSALDSNDFLSSAAGTGKPPFRRNQFGGSAGGPIVKNKTFIFGDYEGLRQAKGIPLQSTVPSPNARLGIVAGGVPANQPAGTPCTTAGNTPGHWLSPQASVCVSDYAASLLPLWPMPSPGTINGDKGLSVSSGLQIVPENFYTGRIDHRLGMNDNLFGTYVYDDTDYTQPDALLNTLTNNHTRRNTLAIEESHAFGSRFLNAARFGYNRDNVLNNFSPTAINPLADSKTLATMPGQSAPRLSVGGGFKDMFGGTNAGSHYTHTWNSYQAYDDAFLTQGTHSIKFGGGIEDMRYNFAAFQNPGGRWKGFGGISRFLQGRAVSFEAGLPQSIVPREFRQNLFGLYIQDDWKMRSNLTLNIGLRYEMTTVLKDGLGKVTNLEHIWDPAPVCGSQFDASAAYGVPPQAGTTCGRVGPYYSNPTLRNFEPRVGFAWDPFKDGKTSVRGGFGVYDVQPLGGYFLLQQNQSAPFMIFKSTTDVAGGFTAGNGQSLLLSPAAVAPLAISSIETNPHRSYIMQWNFNVQRQVLPDTMLTLGYVGSRGVHLLMRGDDGNMTLPTFVPGVGYQFPCGFVKAGDTTCTPGTLGGTPVAGGARSAIVNPAFGVIRYINWNTAASYHALNANLQRRFSRGFQFQFAYTFAKSLDDDSQTIAGDTFSNALNSPYWFLPKRFKGPSDFDVRHNVSINGLWEIPSPKSLPGFAKTLIGGWEMGSIFSMNSGIPTTAIIDGDPMGLGNNGADQFGLPNLVAGCDPVVHNFKANGLNYFNPNCFTLPTVPTSALATLPFPCAPFTGAATPAPAGQTYCANLLGNVSRNSIYGPHFFTWDFSLMKNFRMPSVSEAFNIQFRAEFFNLTNHTNFLPPEPGSGDGDSAIFSTDGSAGTPGTIDKLANIQQPAREIQFGLKINW